MSNAISFRDEQWYQFLLLLCFIYSLRSAYMIICLCLTLRATITIHEKQLNTRKWFK